jgi:peptidoglycan/LPS O-acetylase OafA/YrhL
MIYAKNYACASWVDGHLWSLSVEEQFYLAWPLLVSVAANRTLVVCAVLLVLVAPLSRVVEYAGGARAYFWLSSNADALMLGSLAAMAIAYRWVDLNRLVSVWVMPMRIACCAMIAVTIVLSHHLLLGWFTVTLGPTVQALAATYLICSYAYCPDGPTFAALNARPVVYLGILSYSLYIWQQPFFAKPSAFGLEGATLLEWPYNVLGLIVVAAASYHLLERPLLALRRRLR